jgi:hypothetical protein
MFGRLAEREIRDEMLASYGGRCACPPCPERDPEFLSLERISGTGRDRRRKIGRHAYAALRRRGWPQDGYVLLCWNCNNATRDGRTCPHMTSPVP